MPGYEQSIIASAAVKDREQLASGTHKLEGGVSMLYMKRLQEATYQVNKVVRDVDFTPELPALVQVLLAEIDALDHLLSHRY